MIEDSAERHVGTPWIANGLNEHGMDCIGLVIQVCYDIGLYVPGEIEVPRYKQIPDGNTMHKMLGKYLKEVVEPVRGCVTTFSQPGTGLMHVGIIADRYFYHASLPDKKVVKLSITPNVLTNRRGCFVFERPDR